MSTILLEIIKRLLKAVLVVLGVVVASSFGWMPVWGTFQKSESVVQTAERLKENVQVLSEKIGVRNYASYEKLEQAARYIEGTLARSGYLAERWSYSIEGRLFHNIVARLKRNSSDEYILVGAHYDSCFNPGADDNASGVAALLEMARRMKHIPTEANIIFVAFTNEEPPFFRTSVMGSRVFVRELSARKIQVREAVVFDMIGYYSTDMFQQKYLPPLGIFYPQRGNFIAVVGDFASGKLVDFIQEDFARHNMAPLYSVKAPSTVQGISFSDHASFWEAGIPAVMVTDTAYLRNGHYHQNTDTWEKLDYLKMAAVVEGLIETITGLANKESL